MRAMHRLLVIAAAVAGSGVGAGAQPCEPRWLAGAGVPGTDGAVHAAIEFDFDGPGPRPVELVVGGYISAAGEARAAGAARWDGSRWWPLGSEGTYSAFALWDVDGTGPMAASLVAARTISNPGGEDTREIVLWNGWDWGPIGGGFSGPDGMVVRRLAAFDADGSGPLPPRLFAAGWGFVTFRGAIADWDGKAWKVVAGGVSDPHAPAVYDMDAFDPDGVGPEPERLVVAGNFTAAGGVPASGVASWDGSVWRSLGAGVGHAGLGGYAWALLKLDEDGPGPRPVELFVGGLFESAGGLPASSLAAWDGATWRAIPAFEGLGSIGDLAAFDPDGPGPAPARLVVCGNFASTAPIGIRGIAEWDGAAWSSLGPGIDPNGVLVVLDRQHEGAGRLIAAGNFADGGGGGGRNVAAWDGQAWTALGTGFNSAVRAMTVFDADGAGPEPERLVAGGEFTRHPGGPGWTVAWNDGGGWSGVGEGWSARVLALGVLDVDGPGPVGGRLIAGGNWDGAIGPVKEWTGAQWMPLGSPGLWNVRAIAALDGDGPGPLGEELYIGGEAWPARVLRWDGAAWQNVGEGFTTTLPHTTPAVNALAVLDEDGPGPAPARLYAGGLFDGVGQQPTVPVLGWDGSAWRPVGSGMFGTCLALEPFDPDGEGPGAAMLVAGGMLNVPPTGSCGAARWTGSQWEPLPTGALSRVHAMAPFDPDGPGPALPVLSMTGTGPMSSSGEGRAAIGAWNGSAVEPLGSGIDGILQGVRGSALRAWGPRGSPPRLMVGGQFSVAGGAAAGFLAAWGCGPPRACYANCDGSTVPPVLGVPDFVCFMNRFAAGDPYANCDGSTSPPVLTVGDYVCFLNRFVAGCP